MLPGDFDQARPTEGYGAWPAYGAWLADGAWLARMERRLAKLPRLKELTCTGPSDVELAQLLAGPVAARVQRLDVRGLTSGGGGPDDSLTDLSSALLQVCSSGGRLQGRPCLARLVSLVTLGGAAAQRGPASGPFG